MHGNVWEWCLDWYQSDLGTMPTVDPKGPKTGDHHVIRGGSWYEAAELCRSAFRDWQESTFEYGSIGFRPVRFPKREETCHLKVDQPEIEQAIDTGSERMLPTERELICPICWLEFERGDVLWVAKHPDLMGDPMMGEDFSLRFRATQFDSEGRALDPMGIVCTEMACPHCRRRLPGRFFETDPKRFSIVGAPGSGKSYFLASMLSELKRVLDENFGLSFQDENATDNAGLNEMIMRLFSGSQSPEDLYIEKTQLSGGNYEYWSRDGRSHLLLKPFTFQVTPVAQSDEIGRQLSMVVYDNAGEMFEPNSLRESNAIRPQLAHSSSLLFLFDPTTHPGFRDKLEDKDDPQLERYARLDIQDSILAETRNRIKSELDVGPRERIETPVAVIVGKCDLWEHLISPDEFVDPLKGNALDVQQLEQNSNLTRQLLADLCPSVVANAESISNNVVYFPASSLGHTPAMFTADGRDRLGAIPGKVNPRFTAVPAIWALSLIRPDLISTT